MSDIAAPVPMDQTEALYSKAVSFQAAYAQSQKTYNRTLKWTAFGFACTTIAVSAVLVYILPLKTFVRVVGFVNEAGIYDSASDYSDLPLSTQAAGIESVLSNYLVYRERFVPSEADADYDVVSKLSSDAVRREYQGDANAKFNPQAPAKILGPNGFIRIHVLKGADWISHADDYATGTYKIHFCRTKVVQDQPPVNQRLEEQITYEKVDGVPLDQRTTFNPPGIMVTSYPTAREEGAPGAVNSCG